MPNGKIFRICLILSVLCLTIKGTVLAEDCCDGKGTPTFAGNAEYFWECECVGAKPTIVASSETIVKGGSITLSVTGGCPPYTWSTSSKGYSLTYNKDGTVTLSCTTGTCGTNYAVYATVTVTDNCGVPDTIVIRNTAGTWKNYTDVCVISAGYSLAYNVIGSKRWRVGYRDILEHNCDPASSACGPPSDKYCHSVWYSTYASYFPELPAVTYYRQNLGSCHQCHDPNLGANEGRQLDIFRIGYETWGCP